MLLSWTVFSVFSLLISLLPTLPQTPVVPHSRKLPGLADNTLLGLLSVSIEDTHIPVLGTELPGHDSPGPAHVSLDHRYFFRTESGIPLIAYMIGI